MMNHNTLSRATVLSKTWLSREAMKYVYIFMYALPFIVLIPVYYAASEKIPQEALLNTSNFNKNIYKPLNIALVAATEIFATITDVLLLQKIYGVVDETVSSQSRSRNGKGGKVQAKRLSTSKDLMVDYIATWSFLLIDIALKVLIVLGYPLLFDSIVSIATLAMRARCNLNYGLHMKEVLQQSFPSEQSTDLDASKPKPTSTVGSKLLRKPAWKEAPDTLIVKDHTVTILDDEEEVEEEEV
jgi:hypothetical protein